MATETHADVLVRPVRDVDVEALGRVHAKVWHETYDQLISKATLENVSPKRLAELWTHYTALGPEYRMAAALVDGEIIGFAGSGPARDTDAPAARELYFVYLLDSWHRKGIGRALFDAVVEKDEPLYLWLAEQYPGARDFYEKRNLRLDGGRREEAFLGETITEVRYSRS
ncbi:MULTISPECIES: GNAT family N-acetyltransferase [Microbacterium]|uniref:N-acetyltransferase n=1 Tax=Microbacterium barkeri TaxID=33917 RepID=A0A9W6H4T7_9MICO|nr:MULTISPECIES: GNAT family N-acetyltransferase [Microbacterium]MDI6944624.1 GNAT family N-acetyltransferase [Microbacterium barkeri]MDR6877220.1 GNAT superfamily N-acetyltransferase [Microbacterium barkeri]WRH16458.1 GNAT family N-acetyltransferase [Microbacterium sp. JZ37]GLJ62641.1 N-acetyltransferase [Microbacterium barkeri]